MSGFYHRKDITSCVQKSSRYYVILWKERLKHPVSEFVLLSLGTKFAGDAKDFNMKLLNGMAIPIQRKRLFGIG